MDPWVPWVNPGNDQNLQGHLGNWKFRWYHAQMLVHSPFRHTLYVDIDALPCSGQKIGDLFHEMYQTNSHVGDILKKWGGSCGMAPRFEKERPDGYNISKSFTFEKERVKTDSELSMPTGFHKDTYNELGHPCSMSK